MHNNLKNPDKVFPALVYHRNQYSFTLWYVGVYLFIWWLRQVLTPNVCGQVMLLRDVIRK